MLQPTVENKTYPQMQNLTKIQRETELPLVPNCPGQTLLTSNFGQHAKSVLADTLVRHNSLQSNSNNE